ncbi:glycosyltransferase [Ferruginibacter sp.]|nr:glycosyltransferase [Ferruginibacter sp.]
MDKHLHIVALDVPWPANYGGVVDLFYKLKALHQLGVKIHLHCFTQPGRGPQPELNKYCVSVNYYQRKKNISSFSLSLPFIVGSRKNDELIANLKKDNYPILLEGIHCTYYLNADELNNRKVAVRLHNVEFEYYKQLAKNESNLLKKLYFFNESRLLFNYEKSIANKAGFIAVSEHDVQVYQQLFNAKDIYYLPVFIPHTMAVGKEGKGCFCLYHGNLSINENETAVKWLLQNVFDKLEIPFVIAGKDPSKELQQLAHQHKHTCIVANPGEKEMQDMICKAQIHVLPSFNNTGVKLKLLNALFNGRHCLVNQAGVDGSGLEGVCTIASDAASFKKAIEELYQQPFTEQEKEKRQGLLQTIFNNSGNAEKIASSLKL